MRPKQIRNHRSSYVTLCHCCHATGKAARDFPWLVLSASRDLAPWDDGGGVTLGCV